MVLPHGCRAIKEINLWMMDDKEEKCVSINKNEVKNVHEFHFIYHINVESVEPSLHLRPLSFLTEAHAFNKHTYDEMN